MKINKTLMRSIIYIFVLTCLVLKLSAQNNEETKPSSLAFHLFYNDFKTAQLIRNSSFGDVLKNHQWSKIGDMQMGVGFNYMKGIRRNIDFVATLDGSSTDYLFKDGTTNGSNKFLLDVNAGVNFKLLADRNMFVPYFTGGAGFSSYTGKIGFYIPLGTGVKVNLFDEGFIFTNVQYRLALTSKVNNNFYYSIGVGVSIHKKKKTLPPVVEAKVEVVKAPEIVVVTPPVEIVVPVRDLIVTVRDEQTGLPLPSVEVVITSPDGKMNGLSNTSGQVIFNAVKSGDYTVSGVLHGISTTQQLISKNNFEVPGKEIVINISHSDPRFTLTGNVVNKTTHQPESGVTINLTNNSSTIITEQNNMPDGSFNFQLAAASEFTISGKKASYISNIEKVTTKGLNRSATLYVKLELAIEEAKVGQSIVLNDIYFEVGKANLNTSSSSDLDKLIQFLKDNPTARLEIQGHTDNVGSLAINTKLSLTRANSVVSYLTKNGIDSSRLSAKGFGPSQPIADNTKVEGRAKNRRVVMKVL
jgi:outer membrane protein OmpA-like peptidoglycan-associated protein